MSDTILGPTCLLHLNTPALSQPDSKQSDPVILSRTGSPNSQILDAVNSKREIQEHRGTGTMSETPLLRPKPVRPFDLTTSPTISSSSRPDSPTQDPIASADTDAHPAPPSRTRSILNLTSSTLFGIYSGNGYGEEGATPWSTGTPWGTGAQTPNEGSRRNTATDSRFDFDDALNKNRQRRSSMVQSSAPKTASKSLVKKRQAVSRNDWAPFLGKNIALGVVGVCYGILISHLHDKEQITPVKVKGIPHHSIGYLAGWGIVAVAFGQLMPWVDRYWASEDDDEDVAVSEKYGANGKVGHKRSSSFVNDNGRAENRGMWTPEWYDVVRSIGAFVGIAFAIVCPTNTFLILQLIIDSANCHGNQRSSFHSHSLFRIRPYGISWTVRHQALYCQRLWLFLVPPCCSPSIQTSSRHQASPFLREQGGMPPPFAIQYSIKGIWSAGYSVRRVLALQHGSQACSL